MTDWYYADAANTRHGPITTPALLQLRQQGTLGDGTLLWREGLDGWTPLRTLAHEFAGGASASQLQTPVEPGIADSGAGESGGSNAAAASDPLPFNAASPATGLDAPLQPDAASAETSPYLPPAAPVTRATGIVHGGEVVDAGFLKRAAALLIDALLITAVYYAILIVGVVLLGLGGALGGMGASDSPFGAVGVALMGLSYLAWPLISALYYVTMESSARQATLGKMAVGIKVTGLDGARISRGRALGRWASHLVNYLTLYIGYLVALFTARKQGLHDMVASTYVVDQWAYTAYPERQRRELGTVATVVLVIWAALLLLGVGLVVLAGVMSML